MLEFIYFDNGKYYLELTGMIGNSVCKKEISQSEYESYKEEAVIC